MTGPGSTAPPAAPTAGASPPRRWPLAPPMRLAALAACAVGVLSSTPDATTAWRAADVAPAAIVDTGQTACYDAVGPMACPPEGLPFHGQDAQHRGLRPDYVVNADGTVTDRNTDLVWQRDPGPKVTYAQALAGAGTFHLGEHADWRLPGIGELYSLIHFSGTDPSPDSPDASRLVPFLDASAFVFAYGDPAAGERVIDAQYWSATPYVSTTMSGDPTVFGVNFADGRIKGYPRDRGPGGDPMRAFARYVRGRADYDRTDLVDNRDGTVTDHATGLQWAQADSGQGLDWQSALAYAESLELAGHSDWRLPDAKELQSLVDYTRSPETSVSAAIDPLLRCTAITNEADQIDFPAYWTSTTHAAADGSGSAAVYVAFGRAMGYIDGRWIDVHGAGAQRSDPKAGDPSAYPRGRGPQGDAVRILNHARAVRSIGAQPATGTPAVTPSPPTPGPSPSPTATPDAGPAATRLHLPLLLGTSPLLPVSGPSSLVPSTFLVVRLRASSVAAGADPGYTP